MKWTAREITRSLYLQAFDAKHLIWVPNCYYPGSECDILVVRADLRLMEVEIKISRADLKIDADKDKWIGRRPTTWPRGEPRPPGEPLTHPRRIWKHYYALPRSIWTDELEKCIQPTSGVILIGESSDRPVSRIHRQAKPSKNADKISLEDLCQIARLATVRMFAAQDEIDSHRRAQTDAARRRLPQQP